MVQSAHGVLQTSIEIDLGSLTMGSETLSKVTEERCVFS